MLKSTLLSYLSDGELNDDEKEDLESNFEEISDSDFETLEYLSKDLDFLEKSLKVADYNKDGRINSSELDSILFERGITLRKGNFNIKNSDYNIYGNSEKEVDNLDSFIKGLMEYDADAAQIIENSGIHITIADLPYGINGQARIGGGDIILSRKILDDPEQLIDTFLHELAHIRGIDHKDGDFTEIDGFIKSLSDGEDSSVIGSDFIGETEYWGFVSNDESHSHHNHVISYGGGGHFGGNGNSGSPNYGGASAPGSGDHPNMEPGTVYGTDYNNWHYKDIDDGVSYMSHGDSGSDHVHNHDLLSLYQIIDDFIGYDLVDEVGKVLQNLNGMANPEGYLRGEMERISFEFLEAAQSYFSQFTGTSYDNLKPEVRFALDVMGDILTASQHTQEDADDDVHSHEYEDSNVANERANYFLSHAMSSHTSSIVRGFMGNRNIDNVEDKDGDTNTVTTQRVDGKEVFFMVSLDPKENFDSELRKSGLEWYPGRGGLSAELLDGKEGLIGSVGKGFHAANGQDRQNSTTEDIRLLDSSLFGGSDVVSAETEALFTSNKKHNHTKKTENDDSMSIEELFPESQDLAETAEDNIIESMSWPQGYDGEKTIDGVLNEADVLIGEDDAGTGHYELLSQAESLLNGADNADLDAFDDLANKLQDYGKELFIIRDLLLQIAEKIRNEIESLESQRKDNLLNDFLSEYPPEPNDGITVINGALETILEKIQSGKELTEDERVALESYGYDPDDVIDFVVDRDAIYNSAIEYLTNRHNNIIDKAKEVDMAGDKLFDKAEEVHSEGKRQETNALSDDKQETNALSDDKQETNALSDDKEEIIYPITIEVIQEESLGSDTRQKDGINNGASVSSYISSNENRIDDNDEKFSHYIMETE